MFGIISIMVLSVLFLITNPIMLIVPALMGMELFNENKNEKIRNYLAAERINIKKEYPELTDKEYWLIRDCIIFSFAKKYSVVQPGVYNYTVLEPVLMQHVNTILQTNLIYDLSVFKQILVLLLYISSIVLPLIFFSLHF